MNTTKLLLMVFIPLILLAGIGLFIRIVQYEPLIPDIEVTEKKLQVPILPEDPIVGDKKAAMTIIAFEDFGCETCKAQNDILRGILEEHPKSAKIIWKTLPISRFPQDTTLAARYGFCANEQEKFAEFKDYAFQNSGDLSEAILNRIATEIELNENKLKECLQAPRVDAYIENTKGLAQLLNVQALPAVFIDHKQIQVPTTEAGWKTLLNI